MTEVKEVTAWAVVDKDGKYKADDDLLCTKTDAERFRKTWDDLFSQSAPHRVIRVRIVPDTERQK